MIRNKVGATSAQTSDPSSHHSLVTAVHWSSGVLDTEQSAELQEPPLSWPVSPLGARSSVIDSLLDPSHTLALQARAFLSLFDAGLVAAALPPGRRSSSNISRARSLSRLPGDSWVATSQGSGFRFCSACCSKALRHPEAYRPGRKHSPRPRPSWIVWVVGPHCRGPSSATIGAVGRAAWGLP